MSALLEDGPKPRDRALIEKVAKYYLDYYGIITLRDLRTLLKASERVKDEINQQIRSKLLPLALNELLDSIRQAERDRQVYREYAVDFDENIHGALHVPLTVAVRSKGLYAYITTKNTALAPAYSVLGALIDEMLIESQKFIEQDFDDIFEIKEQVKKMKKMLEAHMDEFPVGEIRRPKRYDPPWLVKALQAYYTYREAAFGVEQRKGKKDLYAMIKWKLYEILTFYLVLKTLSSHGYRVEFKAGKIEAARGSERYVLLFNMPPEGSTEIIKRVDELGDEIIESVKGKPDISMSKNEKLIAFECKYSMEQGYITAGRFKVLAYIYEFGLESGILVFPGIESPDQEVDDEGTVKLVEEAERRGNILDLNLRDDGRKLYLLILDPPDDAEKLQHLMERLLQSLKII
ncbi:MAG: hypothetical protein ACP5GS_06945 [Nitrososphaeria archaeon]